MFISIDEDDGLVEGFTYTNKDGYKEVVHVNTSIVAVEDDGGSKASFYKEDIPKLIKALQAAYAHMNRGK